MQLAMPAAWEGVFMILLSSVDLIMVGVLGTAAIAAVSIFTQPRMMLLTVARSLASAVTVLTAEHFGGGRREQAAAIMRQSLGLGAFVLLGLHLLFGAYLPSLLLWMGAAPEYLALALDYGWIALAAVYVTSLTAILQALQLGFGQTGIVLRTNLQGNVLNLVVNALLIFGLGPFPALGVRGAAIGTLAGTLYTLAVVVYSLWRQGLLRGSFLPDAAYFRQMLPVFGSIFSEQGFERAGMVLYTRMVAELGTIPYAVHAICMNFCDFYYCFAGGLGKARTVLAGQAKGRQDWGGWRISLGIGVKWSLVFSLAACLLTVVFREQIFRLYSQEAAMLPLGAMVLLFVAVLSFPEAQQMVCAGILRGSGRSAQVAAYSFVSIAILRPLITAFLLYTLDMGLAGAWLAVFLDQSLRAGCASFLTWKLAKNPPGGLTQPLENHI